MKSGLQYTGQVWFRAVVEMCKTSHRWRSLSLDFNWFMFKFITENVYSHKYVEPNKLSIFFANVSFLETCLYPAAWCCGVGRNTSGHAAADVEHHKDPQRREKTKVTCPFP